MIDELLEKRQTLFDIAEVLYGEYWVMDEKFWKSKTQKELNEVNNQLENLGYEFDETIKYMDAAKIINEHLNKLYNGKG